MHESGENYLETILVLKEKRGTVRSIDIARELNFSKPSVSRAMGILREDGYICMEPSGEIRLTDLPDGAYPGPGSCGRDQPVYGGAGGRVLTFPWICDRIYRSLPGNCKKSGGEALLYYVRKEGWDHDKD